VVSRGKVGVHVGKNLCRRPGRKKEKGKSPTWFSTTGWGKKIGDGFKGCMAVLLEKKEPIIHLRGRPRDLRGWAGPFDQKGGTKVLLGPAFGRGGGVAAWRAARETGAEGNCDAVC